MDLNIKATVSQKIEVSLSDNDIIDALNKTSVDTRTKFLLKCLDGISFQDFHKIPEDDREKINQGVMLVYNDWNGIKAGSGS